MGNLFAFLRAHVKKHGLGRLFVAPVDVVLDAENTVEPDLVFVSTANAGILQKRAIFGPPDLLVEIVSPSSVRRDRYQKKDLYARFGVKEYWISDAANQSLEILTLKDGGYDLLCSAEGQGRLTSAVLAGLEFDLSDIH